MKCFSRDELVARMRRAAKKLGWEDDAVVKDNKVDEETLKRAHSVCTGVFGVVVLDGSQKVKSVLTVTYESVKDILNLTTIKILLTATPMINRPTDMMGPLSLFWDLIWHGRGPFEPELSDYGEAAQETQR